MTDVFCHAPQTRHMECHPVRHVYRVDIRGVWPSSWMTHRAHSEAVSCDYMDSELAYTVHASICGVIGLR